MNQLTFHPAGETRSTALTVVPGPVAGTGIASIRYQWHPLRQLASGWRGVLTAVFRLRDLNITLRSSY